MSQVSEKGSTLVERFLGNRLNPKTRATYTSTLRTFFSSMPRVMDNDNPSLEEMADRYFAATRDYGQDLVVSVRQLTEAHTPAWTVIRCRRVVQTLFLDSGIPIDPLVLRELKRVTPPARTLTVNSIPTPQQLGLIISFMDAESQAFYLTMKSSGGRMEEVYALTGDCFSPDLTSISFKAGTTKGGRGRFSFIDPEAAAALKRWGVDRKYMWTLQRWQLSNVWIRALAIAARVSPGLDAKDDNTGRYLLTPHSLRKYFRSRIRKPGGLDHDIAEALIGHSTKMDEIYALYTPEQLYEDYSKAMFALACLPS